MYRGADMNSRRRSPSKTPGLPAFDKSDTGTQSLGLMESQYPDQELTVANNELLTLLGNTNLPILIVDSDLRIRHSSLCTQKLMDLERNDTGRFLGDIQLFFELPGFERLIRDSIRSMAVKEFEIQDGGGSWYSMRIHPYKTTDNRTEGAVITWVEVTKMKEALSESKEHYQFLFEHNVAGVFYARNQRIVDCNDSFATILGYSSREELLRSKDWGAAIGRKNRASLYRRLLTEKSLDNVEVCLKRQDGTPVWVLASVNLTGSNSETGAGAEGIMFDITRRVHAEKKLASLSNYLMKSADDRRRSLARELHDEVGSRLGGVSVILATFECDPRLDEKMRNGLAECRKQVQECANEVRTVSYLQHPLIIDDLGLAAAIDWYAENFSRHTGVHVKTDFKDSLARLPGEIEIALYRVIQESLTNIQLHSGAKTACISIKENGRFLITEVRDFGKGFSGSREGMGITGMRERMKELGGRVEIESGSSGTTVRFLQPLTSYRR